MKASLIILLDNKNDNFFLLKCFVSVHSQKKFTNAVTGGHPFKSTPVYLIYP